jgi:hypothetical protein
MERAKLNALFDLIEDIVRAEGNWKKKQRLILDEASEDQKTNLFEFVAWFEGAD